MATGAGVALDGIVRIGRKRGLAYTYTESNRTAAIDLDTSTMSVRECRITRKGTYGEAIILVLTHTVRDSRPSRSRDIEAV